MSFLRRIGMMVVAAAVVTAAASLVAPPAHAANNGQFSVEPTTGEGFKDRPFFVYNLDPGGRVEDGITLSNYTDSPITFLLYASDAQMNADGAFALGNPDAPKDGVASWIQLPTDRVTVPAQTAAQIPFTMTIPTDALSGDHAGGIVALNEAVRSGDLTAGDRGDVAIAGRDGVGARIYVRVTGPVQPSLSVASVDLSPSPDVGFRLGAPSAATVTYRIVNTGNVRIAPTATVSVEGLFGLGGTSLAPRDLPELLPGGSVTITDELDGVPPAGVLTAKVLVTGVAAGSAPVAASGEGRALAVPWLLVLVLVVVIVAVVWVRRRRGRRPPAAPGGTSEGPDPVPPADELVGSR